uniref:Soluble scavenger receptor cysteine-rich domain-containing protein SSC5D n=1 Tax=Gadus morhua TaxID=8049 RepID=A0A8C4ZZH7_GADMO
MSGCLKGTLITLLFLYILYFVLSNVRLVNGSNKCTGSVELYQNERQMCWGRPCQWGTICDDEWGMSNTEVVCRQMGCGHGLSFGSEFGAGSGPIWLDDVVCTGEEDAITQCSHQNYGDNNCGHSEDVGIVCSGKQTPFVWKKVVVICMVLIRLSDIDTGFPVCRKCCQATCISEPGSRGKLRCEWPSANGLNGVAQT